MALTKIISGITGESFRNTLNNNFAQLYPIIVGDKDPIVSTIGMIGQEYLNRIKGTFFICQNISGQFYTWKQIERNDLYPVIIGTKPPVASTVALGEGQEYLNTSENGLYICTNIKGSNILGL